GIFRAAENLIDSVIGSPLVPSDSGILVECGDMEGRCNQDQQMFKGIFFGHLTYFLSEVATLQTLTVGTRKGVIAKYADFVYLNAGAVWNQARNDEGQIGAWWDVPGRPHPCQVYSIETHGSGIAVLICALKVGELLQKLESDGIDPEELR